MKYICYYDIDNHEMRSCFLSAKNKVDYILECLKFLSSEPIQIISASRTMGKKYCPQRLVFLSDKVSLQLFRSFGRKNVITRALDRFLMPIYMLFYLMNHVQKNELVVVYHSLNLMNIVKFAKLIKKFKLIIEYEEIYSDVSGNPKQRKRELNFTKYADGFILATKSLQKALGVNNRHIAICNGTYQVEHQRECNNKFVDNKKNKLINCVYAGTFDPRKGGCFAAIAAAEFLPENYHLHIIGFGSDKDIENVKKLVIETSQKSKAHVTYDGLKSGEDYISFIQSCDIGLSTQNPSGIYNSTSFPSKILSYLANGLRVVSVRIPVVEESDIGQVIYYYDKQTPEEIAKAIVSVDLSKEYDSRDLIRKLDIKFRSDLQHVLFE